MRDELKQPAYVDLDVGHPEIFKEPNYLMGQELLEFLENAPVAIIITDEEGIICAINTEAVTIFHYEKDELLGKPVEILIPEGLHEIHQTHRVNFLRNPSTRKMGHGRDLVGQKKNGNTVPVELALRYYRDIEQIRVVIFVSDITNRKKAEHDLRASEYRYRTLFEQAIKDINKRKQAEEDLILFQRAIEQSVSLVLITDTDGIIEFVNPAFTRLSGYSAIDVIGQKPSISKSGKTSSKEYQQLWQVITSGDEWHGELLNCKKDGGYYWVSASISPVKNSDGVIAHYLAIQEDITERKQIEEALHQKNEQLATLSNQLQLANEKMTKELHLAGEVQQSFFPGELPHFAGWQFAAKIRPARETSGDFYDMYVISENQIGFLVADVVDKGVGAALFMALCLFIFRHYSEQYPFEPEKVLSAVNRRILQDTNASQFVTAFYGVLNLSNGELNYCNAGHPPALLIKGRDKSPLQELKRTGMPLGLYKDQNWDRGVVDIHSGDLLAIYSDGITEAQNPEGAFFDDTGLLKSINKNIGRHSRDIVDSVFADLQTHDAGLQQADDMALMVIRRE